jgi:ATP-dependent exoDNAse (exonuclease V) alpha subunit
MTLDALTARANTGSVDVGADTTIILDEAGMVDHKRLDALTDLVERSGAKLIAVGDGKQLPSIGPGGMFDRLAGHAPTVELETIHRTTDPHEQQAWHALRAGDPERAIAHYKAQGDSTSPTPATRQPRAPSKLGHNSPRKQGSTKSR